MAWTLVDLAGLDDVECGERAFEHVVLEVFSERASG
jgi:hypothetical protein